MTDQLNLEALYAEARQALKRREYDRAAAFLKQILLVDENYKDASRLLAQAVKLKRRRWYNDARVAGTLAVLILIGAGVWLGPRLTAGIASRGAAPESPTAFPSPTIAPTATETTVPAPTAIPLSWRRVNLGLDFPRDLITTIAIDPRDPAVVYIGTSSAGIYKSIDGGATWRPVHNGLEHTAITTLLIDPSDPLTVYAEASGAVFKTSDGGERWSNVTGWYSTGPNVNNGFVMDSQDPRRLWLSDPGHLYVSPDGGVTWIQKTPPTYDYPHILLAEGDTIFLSDNGGSCSSYRSSDGGETWEEVHCPQRRASKKITRLIHVTVAAGQSDYYALSEESSGVTGLISSRDGGLTWDFMRTGCDFLATDASGNGFAFCAGRLMSLADLETVGYPPITTIEYLAFSPGEADTLYASGSEGLFVSRDGGRHWEELQNGLGMRAVELKRRPEHAELYLVDSYSSAMGAFPGRVCSLYRSGDKGLTWQQLLSQQAACGLTFGPGGETLHWRGEGADSRISWDGGDSWTYSGLGRWTPHPLLADWYIYYGDDLDGFNRAHLSDGGKLYYPNDPNPGSEALFTFDPQDEKTLWVSGSNNSVATSFNRGLNWWDCGLNPYQQTLNLALTDTRMLVDVLDPRRLYLATRGQGVLVSQDGCYTWERSNAGLSNLFINSLTADPTNPGTVFVGTESGAYISYDSGRTWNQINDGLLGALVVYSIVVDNEGTIFAATPYGIFRLEGK